MIAPTVIIGLGGIGSDICCRVSRMVKADEQRSRIRFVCIDTDINDLRQRREEDPRIITIQTSAPYMVYDYLNTNTKAKQVWFPNHNILMHKTPTEGAGQVRAISRLAFEEAVKEGRMTALDKAIEELYYLDGAAEAQAVRVMIVSTLAGGTGSGIVLPAALYVRNFLETRFRKSASVMRGFFLLPEIMFGNKSPEEKNSLCGNAYASIRELDAFMRRGDGALPYPKYKDLKLELPDPSSGTYVDYRVSPFNFCFLYDKRNTDDLQLKSFDDYKEHAANTIYTQTISGISSRSNSNEDNAIKPLVKSNGRNRFCGAGSSLLKYPKDSVLRYIAGKWCIQVMGEDWLSIDKAYDKYLKEQKEQRKKNPRLPQDQKLSDFYVEHVEKSSDQDGSFGKMIHDMCHDSVEDETGNIVAVSRIGKYTQKLDEIVRNTILKDDELEEAGNEFKAKYAEISKAVEGQAKGEEKIDRKDYADELLDLSVMGTTYINASKALGNRLGRILASRLFDDKDHTEDTSPEVMEFYMKDDELFIHPNASRYFVYALRKAFIEGRDECTRRLEELQRSINVFDDPNTQEIEQANTYIGQHQKKLAALMGKKTRIEILDLLQFQHEKAFDFALYLSKKSIFESGVAYLEKLASAYESFFGCFASYLQETHAEVAEIEKKYVNGEGKATRYVCSSEACLKAMLEEMPCGGNNVSVNGPLSSLIFNEIKKYALMTKRPNANVYFGDFYSSSILGFWEDLVMQNHEKKIDMDIIDALKAEADYEKSEALTDDQKDRYVANILQQSKKLAAPFIEEPMGEIRHPFTISAYNGVVAGEPDSTRRAFVGKHLNETMGGQIDNNVSKYELLIYTAVYNLSAGDLKRFKSPENGSNFGGEYYNAYIDVIKQLGPMTDKNPVLTPHIDRSWHLTKYMPDLDERNQKILDGEIYTALLWGLVTGKIKQKYIPSDIDEGEYLFRYTPVFRKDCNFVVSNGTSCDELYEVLDALSINPPMVEMILNDMKKVMTSEERDTVSLSQTKLMRSLHWTDKNRVFFGEADLDTADSEAEFVIRECAPGQKATIFDLLYWLKVSTPANGLSDDEATSILESFIETVENYVSHFVDAENVYDKCFVIFLDQFNQFINNMMDETIPGVHKRMSSKIIEIISNTLIERSEDVYKQPDKKVQIFEAIYDRAMNEYVEKRKK